MSPWMSDLMTVVICVWSDLCAICLSSDCRVPSDNPQRRQRWFPAAEPLAGSGRGGSGLLGSPSQPGSLLLLTDTLNKEISSTNMCLQESSECCSWMHQPQNQDVFSSALNTKIKSNSVKSDSHLRAFWLSWLASLTPLWISSNHSSAPGSLLTWMDTRMQVPHFWTACGSSLRCWDESQLPVTLYLWGLTWALYCRALISRVRYLLALAGKTPFTPQDGSSSEDSSFSESALITASLICLVAKSSGGQRSQVS